MTVRPWQTGKEVQSSLPLARFVTGCDGRVAANYRRCHSRCAHILQNISQLGWLYIPNIWENKKCLKPPITVSMIFCSPYVSCSFLESHLLFEAQHFRCRVWPWRFAKGLGPQFGVSNCLELLLEQQRCLSNLSKLAIWWIGLGEHLLFKPV